MPVGQPVPYGRAILSTNAGDSPIDPPPGARAKCIEAQLLPHLRVCDVHVDPGELSHSPFEPWEVAGPLILGGDFNRPPRTMPSFYDSMFEADPSNAPTDGGPIAREKIDYIFADNVHFEESTSGDVLQMLCTFSLLPRLNRLTIEWCSDHRMVIGEFPTVPPPPARDEGACEIPRDRQILDRVPEWVFMPTPAVDRVNQVVDKECVNGFLVVEVSATVNRRVWSAVVAEHYRNCFVTQRDCASTGGGISWWASDPDGQHDPLDQPCSEHGPDTTFVPAVVWSAVCDIARRG